LRGGVGSNGNRTAVFARSIAPGKRPSARQIGFKTALALSGIAAEFTAKLDF
jgi:hypothetical protein